MKSDLFVLTPDIRAKILFYKGSLLGIFIVWSIFIANISGLKEVIFYMFVYSWVISLFLIIVWGFKYIYNSKKYIILKIVFQFGILWAPYLSSIFNEFKLAIIFGYTVLIWIIQFRNFIENFRNYKEEEENFDKGVKRFFYGDFEEVFGSSWKEKDMKKALSRISLDPRRFNYARLYQYSLYKYTGSIILLIVVYYATNFITGFLFNILGTINSSYGIGLLILTVPLVVSKAFDKKDTIENLFLMNKKDRKGFEKDILYTALWYNTRLMTYIILSLTIMEYRLFYKNSNDFNILLHAVLPAGCIICGYLLIYIKWKQNKSKNNTFEYNESGA
ncbi:MAG: hypothetical protein PHU51_05860 [Candidatus Nanoarchaeia archaeon]|nr:hypothetical protein [Candidatus Nanoarchaeia archaeon]MDD4205817.1 hypothetical protein [Candidatus Delongbacteria bacterium]